MLLIQIILVIVTSCLSLTSYGQKQVIDSVMHHVRNGDSREWVEFPATTDEQQLVIDFPYQKNTAEQTLSLRQYDVKQDWKILINGYHIGSLASDEKDMMVYFKIPAGTLRDGENRLSVKTTSIDIDDIRIGNIALDNRAVRDVLTEATVDITVIDSGSDQMLPSRITILNADRTLQTVTLSHQEGLAVRPGYVYTGSGRASLKFPAGRYTIYAGRGFEYGIDSVQLELTPGDHLKKVLHISREVDTRGWISSDTHVHTFSYSHHGDATAVDRAITLAGEGIELPILTDHNIYVDLKPIAREANVLSYFTPVVGDELTTKVGHFNVFPTTVGMAVINPEAQDWNSVSTSVNNVENTKAVILNHARDIHNEFRPFDPSRHVASAGVRSDDWKVPVNAMEVINSGSQQTDIMQLYRDWFGMMNHGYFLTPVGSSDSHDVSRFTVGQGRTYILSQDNDPSNIDMDNAIKNFRAGKVMVSLGLLAKIMVNNTYGPGDVVSTTESVAVSVEVWGPAWSRADHVTLYANGRKVREEKITYGTQAGIKWKGSWQIPLPSHDIFLVAIAEGPGTGMPYWPIAKPYQPASQEWRPTVLGSTGAVWIDADKNGKRNSAFEYAQQIVTTSKGDINKMIKRLAAYDEAIAIQVAALLWKNGNSLRESEIVQALKTATPSVKAGFDTVIKEIAFINK